MPKPTAQGDGGVATIRRRRAWEGTCLSSSICLISTPENFKGATTNSSGLLITFPVQKEMIAHYIISCAASYRFGAPSHKTVQHLIRGDASDEFEKTL